MKPLYPIIRMRVYSGLQANTKVGMYHETASPHYTYAGIFGFTSLNDSVQVKGRSGAIKKKRWAGVNCTEFNAVQLQRFTNGTEVR